MIKEKINMERKARIVLIFSISSLILYLSVEGLSFLPSIAQPNSKLDKTYQLAKDQRSPVLDEEAKETSRPLPGTISSLDQFNKAVSLTTAPLLGPVSSSDEAKAALATTLDEARQGASPVSFLDEALRMAQDQVETKAHISSTPVSSPVPQDPISSQDGISDVGTPSTGNGAEAMLGPVSSSDLVMDTETSSPVPSPSIIGKEGVGFFDHDIALAIEARIKQSQSDLQLAMDEAKRLLKDPNIASSKTGKCLSGCLERYTGSLNQLYRAIADLGARDVALLADDFGAVETYISTCQACFTESIGEDSPLKALEEANTKAARECLTVMDYAS